MSLPRLCAIVDDEAARARGWAARDLARAYLDGGATWLQVRGKTMSGRELLELSEAVVRAAEPYGAMVLVNDRADLARLAGAAGVHVGQDDLAVEAVRRVVGPTATVGVSTHSDAQVAEAAGTEASYVGVGPVYATGTKDTGYAPVGLDLVRRAARTAGRPIVAIGGITLERAPEALSAGASAVAVIGDLLESGDPGGRVRAYLRAVGP
jgi:thiamine-phosphate pyrophosphorylase